MKQDIVLKDLVQVFIQDQARPARENPRFQTHRLRLRSIPVRDSWTPEANREEGWP